jgi:hypothetical protein
MDINAGQTLMVDDAEVFLSSNVDDVGGSLDAESQRIIENESVFFVVDPGDIEIVSPS